MLIKFSRKDQIDPMAVKKVCLKKTSVDCLGQKFTKYEGTDCMEIDVDATAVPAQMQQAEPVPDLKGPKTTGKTLLLVRVL